MLKSGSHNSFTSKQIIYNKENYDIIEYMFVKEVIT